MKPPATADLAPPAPGRCYGCFRPREDCFCAAIPAIDNQTEVLILQHKRERFHPFGTARIVERALNRCELRVGLDGRFAAGLDLKPGAGLLYPGPDSELLEKLPPERRPRQLVVLDGTWHHAKTMFRDLPELHALPRFRLAPSAPSQYGFRREPHAQFISTVEATVAALRLLEPQLNGLDALNAAFLTMVNRQLGRPKVHFGARKRARPRRTVRNVPVALAAGLENVVVAYGESFTPKTAAGATEAPNPARIPAYWVAERLGTGETCALRTVPPAALNDTLLRYWEQSPDDFAAASSLPEARTVWRAFLRPTDVLTVFNQGVADLAAKLAAPQSGPPCLVLRSVDLHPGRRYGTLDELLAGEGIVAAAPRHPGRAGKRLANLAAYVRHLHAAQLQARVISDRYPVS
jgi:DTW domain-containing protein YfiP